jgi:hypothetical protein
MCCILYYGFYSDEVIGLVDSRSSVLEIQKHPTMDSAPSMFPRSPQDAESWKSGLSQLTNSDILWLSSSMQKH